MITTDELAGVAAAWQREPSLAALRAAYPALHFTECSEDDVSPRHTPALDLDDCALYLVSGASGHCLELHNDPSTATGVLVALRDDDA